MSCKLEKLLGPSTSLVWDHIASEDRHFRVSEKPLGVDPHGNR